MSKPIVAIVGRPNVGKSTFFNKVVGRRISIVEDTPGVTRDRIIAEAEWTGHHFFVIDTGGIEPDSKEIIPAQMRMQAELAMDMADVILFLVDGRDGLTTADEEVGAMLRRKGKDVILVGKGDPFAVRFLYAYICIAGNTEVLLQLPIADALIPARIFFAKSA